MRAAFSPMTTGSVPTIFFLSSGALSMCLPRLMLTTLNPHGTAASATGHTCSVEPFASTRKTAATIIGPQIRKMESSPKAICLSGQV